jgi:hypothetical protein
VRPHVLVLGAAMVQRAMHGCCSSDPCVTVALRFTVQVDEDPWDGEPLPQGAAVPEKPLVADEAGWCSQQ